MGTTETVAPVRRAMEPARHVSTSTKSSASRRGVAPSAATFETVGQGPRDARALDTAYPIVKISGIELVALKKKLSLVSHELASKLDHSAGQEQTTLATVLDDVIRRIEIAIASDKNRKTR